MKKFVGFVVALTLLCTMASALEFADGTGYDEDTGKVVALYTGYGSGQATMLAYDVTNVTGATVATEFIDNDTTPIVGIDQESADGSFEFPIPEDFSGKIILKVGGKDLEPISVLLEIGGGDVEQITLLFGDINGDGVISSADGTAIIKSTSGGTKTYKDYTIGLPIGSSGVLFGDINGDGVISSADGTAIIKSTSGGTKTYKSYEIGKDATFAK